MAELAPGLVALREEFNALNPDRDKRSDGWIGDEAHQQTSSDHNPDDTSGSKTPQTDSDSKADVRAIDVDKSGPWPHGLSFDSLINELVRRRREGEDHRADLIIWNRRKASDASGWKWVDYTGSNAHTEHAHISIRTEPYEDDRSPWGLVEKWGDMALTSDDKKWIEDTIKKYVGDVVPRYDENGDKITGSGNDTMTVASGVEYTGRDLKWVLQDLGKLVDAVQALTPPPAAPAKATTAKK